MDEVDKVCSFLGECKEWNVSMGWGGEGGLERAERRNDGKRKGKKEKTKGMKRRRRSVSIKVKRNDAPIGWPRRRKVLGTAR